WKRFNRKGRNERRGKIRGNFWSAFGFYLRALGDLERRRSGRLNHSLPSRGYKKPGQKLFHRSFLMKKRREGGGPMPPVYSPSRCCRIHEGARRQSIMA